MTIDRIGFDKRTVVVLGAGATRGAEFVKTAKGAEPPLDRDFFTQAQRLSTKKPAKLVDQLIEDVVTTFGNNFSLTMEGYLTRLEQMSHVLNDYKFRGRPPTNKFLRMRAHFLQVLAALMDEAVGRNPNCAFHTRLVERLSAADTILSLNYDWLIDLTLKRHGHKKWNPKKGYGVPVYSNGPRGAGTKYWACSDDSGKPDYSANSITLLKLHGSLNWFPVPPDRNPPMLALRKRWWHQNGNLTFEIAAPEWNKPTRSGIDVPVWRRARKSLKSAKGIVFIGYSLPETDLPIQALLTVESSPTPVALLVIVNPNQSSRNRIRATLGKRIDGKTRVLSFDRFEQFHAFIE
jgi:hypothetical protein